MSANETMLDSDPADTERIDPVLWMVVHYPERVKRVERRVRIGEREKIDIVTLGGPGDNPGGEA